MAKKKSAHYVDNKKFLQAMIEWNDECKKKGEQVPITNYIGECFLKIATHLSYRPNFINYTYRDEMISDGIENCLQYVKNFNPEKSKNPFAYFTQIIYYAFIRRIQKEKKQGHVRNKMIEKILIQHLQRWMVMIQCIRLKGLILWSCYQMRISISQRRLKVKVKRALKISWMM